MDKFIRTVLSDNSLTIEQYEDNQGQTYYLGKSPYTPHKAKAPSVFRCLLKFNFALDEQKRLTGLLKDFK